MSQPTPRPPILRRLAAPSKLAACSRCGALVGGYCTSPTGRRTRAHGERLAARGAQ